jgi:hypothetical protein
MKKITPIILATTVLAGGLFTQPGISKASFNENKCEAAKKSYDHAKEDIKTIERTIEYIKSTESTKDDQNLPAKYELLEKSKQKLEQANWDIEKYCGNAEPSPSNDFFDSIVEWIQNLFGGSKEEPQGYEVPSQEEQSQSSGNSDSVNVTKGIVDFTIGTAKNVKDTDAQAEETINMYEDTYQPLVDDSTTDMLEQDSSPYMWSELEERIGADNLLK